MVQVIFGFRGLKLHRVAGGYIVGDEIEAGRNEDPREPNTPSLRNIA